MSSLLAVSVLVTVSSCGGLAERYGYARRYAPNREERALLAANTRADRDPSALCRDPARERGAHLSWFGIVRTIEAADMAAGAGNDGWADAVLYARVHREPHRCYGAEASTCRVTVSERNGHPFRVRLQLAPDEWSGEWAVRPGSLVRVYGEFAGEPCDPDTGPLLRAQYYRHWPRGQFAEVLSTEEHTR